MDKKIGDMDKKIGKMDKKMNKKIDLLLSASPKVIVDSLKLQLVPEPSVQNVKYGASATWTIVNDLNDEFWAIGAAHCAFYYAGNFVHIPQELIQYGIECIYIHKELLDTNTCSFLKYDAVAIKLANVQGHVSTFQWPHNAPLDTNFFNVGGKSTATYISGDNTVFDNENGVYVFVEESGEPGNSGTLMFSLRGSPRFVGVYYGLLEKVKKMKARGVIVPLNLNEMIKCDRIKPPKEVKLGVPKNGHIVDQKIKINTNTQIKGFGYYTVNRERFYGFVIRKVVQLCGAMVVGDVKRLQLKSNDVMIDCRFPVSEEKKGEDN